MRCPNCDKLPTPVIKTERDEAYDNVKRRKRVCRDCRHVFYTYEVTQDEFERIYPKDNDSPKNGGRKPLRSKKEKEK